MNQHLHTLMATATATLLLLNGCGGYDNEDKNVVGADKIVAPPELLFEINASVMQQAIAQQLGITDKPAFGVKGYKIVYRSKDDLGNDINVSGLITVPVPTEQMLAAFAQQGKPFSLSIVSDQHGTIFPDFEAPTTAASITKQPYGAGTLFSAVAGFMTLQPDYIGFGTSKGVPHPYLLEKSSANVVIDMIEAAVKFGNDAQLPLNGQIFLTGYSEGGYATLAAADEIENHYPDLHLQGVAPMSGPYDLNLIGMGVLSTDTMARPDFIGGIVYSYSYYYDITLTDIVNEPYATTLPTLYDAQHTGEQIRAELTESVADFFVPTYRADFLTNPSNSLRTLFAQNSVDDYTPIADTRLYYCGGDSVIPPAVAQSAAQKMGVEAIDLNDTLDHVPCAQAAYPAVAAWFDQLRSN